MGTTNPRPLVGHDREKTYVRFTESGLWTPIRVKNGGEVNACASISRPSSEDRAPLKNFGSGWNPAEVAGRLVEVSGWGATASLTLAFSLVLEAQRRGEPVGWVTPVESFFYPPDVARGGVDLNALVVVRVPAPESAPRAAEKLLRSGAFGLVVLDIERADIPTPLQTRLAGLARQHHTTLLCLTEKESREFSLGSLISLWVHAERRRTSEDCFICELKVLKDKRRGPTWTQAEICCGPVGLR